MTKPPVIELIREDDWLTIWLNRPENRNALSSEMTGALLDTFQDLATDQSIRGVTIRGKGGTFCAGGDLKEFIGSVEGGQTLEEAKVKSRHAGELFSAVHILPQVVVVLIEGAAMAGGLGMACAADIVAGTKSAKFALTETMIGLPPAQIAPYVVRRTGSAIARRIMLTGMRFDGSQALEFGLLDYVCENAAELSAFETELRRGVISCAPHANTATKEILRAVDYMNSEDLIDFAAEKFAACLLSTEARDGIVSFIEKRRPYWARSS
ncbi:hypothetical protein LCGC14_1908610 [marine sediment metagenome]|uniref:Enoyl-CoA hydratase n=1 Tax=marine sediment metagenome TaxID=412755 RepID=A0A0F9GHK8_9ZZZZ